ncbi:HAD family phosphatase [Henriciella barbarensis]|uniref:HAD family phosphatase n=1 Tax=Henriciella barbarensis TaxID=86342 RepID=A0A399QYN1_9PROT|nr:HAD family phosphatase [Henriciella barbarensis]RIJ24020.1 HAD family phosphatase [Henriciella barbarensis]
MTASAPGGNISVGAEPIVLFDLGNVVIDWLPLRLYRKIFASEAEAEAFCRDVCNMDWHVEHDRGRTFAEGARLLKQDHPHYADEIDAWHRRWFEMFDGYVSGVPALIARLEEAQVPLFALSNMSAEIWPETVERFPMLKLFRDVVVSGEEELIKPDPAIYELTHARLGQPPKDSVFFIDDSLKNIEAARAYGFRGHHFTDAESLEAALIEEGLLAPAA